VRGEGLLEGWSFVDDFVFCRTSWILMLIDLALALEMALALATLLFLALEWH
jgi:hypothetical protein